MSRFLLLWGGTRRGPGLAEGAVGRVARAGREDLAGDRHPQLSPGTT